MHHESMTSLLARWLFALTLLCIHIFCIFCTVLLWGIWTKQIETIIICHYWKLFPLSVEQYLPTSGKQFPLVTSSPVTICIIGNHCCARN